MAYQFYVNMQKRGDGKVYADLHKTDGHIYFDEVEPKLAILLDAEIADHRHVVEMVAMTAAEYDELIAQIPAK